MVRFATNSDRYDFLMLWRDMLIENHSIGGEILPSDKNISIYGQLFDAYLERRMTGTVLVAEQDEIIVGVLMWGQGGTNPFETTFGKSAMGWGTYVAPEYRGRGLSTELRREAARWLRLWGFDTVVGSAVDTNHAGIASGLGSGGFHRHGIVGVVRLSA